jgi:hypothetical protein
MGRSVDGFRVVMNGGLARHRTGGGGQGCTDHTGKACDQSISLRAVDQAGLVQAFCLAEHQAGRRDITGREYRFQIKISAHVKRSDLPRVIATRSENFGSEKASRFSLHH